MENLQLYTPAMLAELVSVPVRTVRRWQQAGFLRPVREVLQLPYFDYESLSLAKQLKGWMAQGATVQSIQNQLAAFQRRAGRQTTLADLPITADGKRLVLRHGDSLLEATGQLRFGFDSSQSTDAETADILPLRRPAQAAPQAVHSPPDAAGLELLSVTDMVDEAQHAEDLGDYETAIEWYRSALTVHGPNADVCFQLAELLYREGDLNGSRERYFMALELNPEMVEARANLGCVLMECGRSDLAVAAFEGTLRQFPEYADVHFHLARVLDDLGETNKAVDHWQQFLELAPASPWAEEARERLQQQALLEF